MLHSVLFGDMGRSVIYSALYDTTDMWCFTLSFMYEEGSVGCYTRCCLWEEKYSMLRGERYHTFYNVLCREREVPCVVWCAVWGMGGVPC